MATHSPSLHICDMVSFGDHQPLAVKGFEASIQSEYVRIEYQIENRRLRNRRESPVGIVNRKLYHHMEPPGLACDFDADVKRDIPCTQRSGSIAAGQSTCCCDVKMRKGSLCRFRRREAGASVPSFSFPRPLQVNSASSPRRSIHLHNPSPVSDITALVAVLELLGY